LDSKVLDQLGFVKEGEHLLVLMPAWEAVLPFRIRARVNKGAEVLNYGPFPYTFSGYPEGVVPDFQTTTPVTFKDITGRYPAERAADMFYLAVKDRDTLVHAYVDIRPRGLFRIYQWIPSGAKQIRLLKMVTFEEGPTPPPTDFGYSVGVKEQVFLPTFHIDWALANRTNMDLRTYVVIRYAEYRVELVKDPAIIFKLLQREIPAHWFTLVAEHKFAEGEALFEDVYKIKPIPLYRKHEQERARREIPELVKEAVV